MRFVTNYGSINLHACYVAAAIRLHVAYCMYNRVYTGPVYELTAFVMAYDLFISVLTSYNTIE